jgi:hypothetical protein
MGHLEEQGSGYSDRTNALVTPQRVFTRLDLEDVHGDGCQQLVERAVPPHRGG